MLRFLTPKKFRNRGGGWEEKMRCVSDARRQPTSRVRPSPTSIQRRLLLGGRGTAMRIGHHPRAGDLAGKEGGRPGGSQAPPTPLPQVGGRMARCGNPAAPDLKGDGCGRPPATHLAPVAHLPRVCGVGDMQDTRLTLPGAAGPQRPLLHPDSPTPQRGSFQERVPLRPAPWPIRPSIAGRGRSKGVGRGYRSPLAHT